MPQAACTGDSYPCDWGGRRSTRCCRCAPGSQGLSELPQLVSELVVLFSQPLLLCAAQFVLSSCMHRHRRPQGTHVALLQGLRARAPLQLRAGLGAVFCARRAVWLWS